MVFMSALQPTVKEIKIPWRSGLKSLPNLLSKFPLPPLLHRLGGLIMHLPTFFQLFLHYLSSDECIKGFHIHILSTGKSLSKALILVHILLTHYMTTDCSLNYEKNTSSKQVVYKTCFFVCVLTFERNPLSCPILNKCPVQVNSINNLS